MNRIGERLRNPRLWVSVGLLIVFLLFGGCGGDNNSAAQPHPTPIPPTPTPTPTPVHTITGFLYGGPPSTGSAISGATITAYQAGASGYGQGALALAQTSSQSDGSFSLASLTCAMSGNAQQVYLVATGGTVNGQSSANSAIALSAALGTCDALPASVVINETTTIATIWSLSQFADSSGQNIGTSATNQTGLSNAMKAVTSKNLVDVTTGLAPTSFADGLTSPTAAMYTLANILASCVDSSGASSPACQSLFSAATPPGGSPPATTLEAALDIARNPVNNVATLYALAPANPPFSPGLAVAPESWLLTLNYASSDAEFNFPYAIALDAAGDVWVTNAGGNSVTELPALNGYTNAVNLSPQGAALQFPTSLAVDNAGNVWVTNFTTNSVSELTAASGYSTGFNFAPPAANLEGPFALALDPVGNIWVANFSGDSVSELSADCSGQSCSGANFNNASTGNPGAAFNKPASIAADATGNIWAANFRGDSVSELEAGCSSASCVGENFNNANTGAPGAMFNAPIALALDGDNDVWTANSIGDSASELLAGCTSAACSGRNFNNSNTGNPGATFDGPNAIALDAIGNVWLTNEVGNSLSELTAFSGEIVGLNFGPWPTFHGQFSLATDSAGNVWIANNYDDSVSEALGLAKPVLTPHQACLKAGHNVCLP